MVFVCRLKEKVQLGSFEEKLAECAKEALFSLRKQKSFMIELNNQCGETFPSEKKKLLLLKKGIWFAKKGKVWEVYLNCLSQKTACYTSLFTIFSQQFVRTLGQKRKNFKKTCTIRGKCWSVKWHKLFRNRNTLLLGVEICFFCAGSIFFIDICMFSIKRNFTLFGQ